MTVSISEGLRAIALSDIQLSGTESQAERRKRFDKVALSELSASIKAHGVLVPVIVRPVNGHFELIAGERRYLASKTAGVDAINAHVRELTDEQALEIQLIENLQREGLHELAEAEGYEKLQGYGHTAIEIADKVGKSKAYVYARMKLLALSKDARKAFYDSKISASVALLLARIPVEDLQKQALKEVLDNDQGWGDPQPMSYREAADHIQEHYMLRLKEAPFPVGDEKLVPAAGSCNFCPKNTAQQRELFSDVEHASAGVCTDPVCFKAKRMAFGEQAIARATETKQKVIDGAEAKKITKYGTTSLQGGYVSLDSRCLTDSKHRTYRQILGKNAKPALLKVPGTGDVIEIVEAPRERSSSSSSNEEWKARQRAEEKKQKRERAFRIELFTQVRLLAPEKLTRPDLDAIAEVAFMGIGYEAQKQLLKAWGWTGKDDKPMDPYAVRGKRLKEEIASHSDAELVVFLLDCVYAEELAGTDSRLKPERLLAAAKRLKVDPEKIRKELAVAEKPKVPAKVKVAKKKSTGKAK